LRGAHHVLNLLIPYLEPSQRLHLQALVTAYTNTAHAPMDAKPSKLKRQELLAK